MARKAESDNASPQNEFEMTAAPPVYYDLQRNNHAALCVYLPSSRLTSDRPHLYLTLGEPSHAERAALKKLHLSSMRERWFCTSNESEQDLFDRTLVYDTIPFNTRFILYNRVVYIGILEKILICSHAHERCAFGLKNWFLWLHPCVSGIGLS
jgi:hypothetical protein